ncbi:MAG TPA: putative toxin-antitoxin system toxin component, PIN family, partial [Xanthomonadales bacterium]|nr:putative toxin-antitoxin system toxin component, PIN family [Xanthomonadales bacterium]
MTPADVRVVLDTNTWLDVLWFRDPRSADLAAALADRRLLAVASPACREEWRRVLGYPALGIDDAARDALAEAFDERVELLADAPPSPRLPRCRDRDDQKFLELALAAGAAALFTRDAALLALAKRCRR